MPRPKVVIYLNNPLVCRVNKIPNQKNITEVLFNERIWIRISSKVDKPFTLVLQTMVLKLLIFHTIIKMQNVVIRIALI